MIWVNIAGSRIWGAASTPLAVTFCQQGRQTNLNYVNKVASRQFAFFHQGMVRFPADI